MVALTEPPRHLLRQPARTTGRGRLVLRYHLPKAAPKGPSKPGRVKLRYRLPPAPGALRRPALLPPPPVDPAIAARLARRRHLALAGRHGIAALGLALLLGPGADSETVRGSIEARTDIFPRQRLFPDQAETAAQAAALVRLRATTKLDDNTDAVLSGRGMLTPSAQQRAFGDLGEAYLERRFGAFATRIGVLDERWGVLDAANPVNIFNQLDLVEDYQGDTRLGQPGVSLKYVGNDLTFTLLGSPVARERRLTDGRDRLRISGLPLVDSRFEGGRVGPSVAGRVAYNRGGLELALSHFHGTSREPEFEVLLRNNRPVLRPFYRIIDQTSIDGQYVLGDYVLRGEFIHRIGQTGRSFVAGGVGAERIFYGAFGGAEDVGLFVEYYRDGRPKSAPITAFDNDLAVGGRIQFNNPGSTELTGRAIVDLHRGSTVFETGVRHRILEKYLLALDVTVPVNVRDDRALAGFRRDPRFRFSLAHYF